MYINRYEIEKTSKIYLKKSSNFKKLSISKFKVLSIIINGYISFVADGDKEMAGHSGDSFTSASPVF